VFLPFEKHTEESASILFVTGFAIAMKLLRIAAALAAPSTSFAFLTRSPRVAFHRTALAMSDDRYTIPDQPARFARAKKENNQRYLDITTVYDGSFLNGKRVAVTGANRGIGLALCTELAEQGAKVVALCRSTSDELEALKPDEVITGVDQTDDEVCALLSDKIKGGPIDIVRVVTMP
jgi:NADPH:quinone reductase-like Zn-dependent oxidoreductase